VVTAVWGEENKTGGKLFNFPPVRLEFLNIIPGV
jgi:hypothetical protein